MRNSENKSKASWRVINFLTKIESSREISYDQGDPSCLPNRFNDFFVDFPSDITEMLEKTTPDDRDKLNKSFFMFDISHDEVLKAVRSLKNKLSCGNDEIPIRVLKSSINIILEPLSFIINRCFKEKMFPDQLKVAIVKPLHKKGDISDPNSYRPISILPSFSKVFEKILTTRLLKFFKKFGVISECQHGFVKNRSTETAELINEVVVSIEQGEIPISLFLDLTRAFDCVEHGRLLEILEDCGIKDNQLRLLESYLTSRKQIVIMEIDSEILVSDEREILMGVPQGSIAGPVLFIVYINFLPKMHKPRRLRCSTRMFADDANYLIRSLSIFSASIVIILILIRT